MRFADARSKAQIAAYQLHELHASRWRNARNLERWNDACRSRWELEQLGAVQKREPIDMDGALPV